MAMHLSVDQFRQGFRNGTLAFCLPAAHAELSSDFLEGFSERILKQDWREVSMVAHLRLSKLLTDDDTECDLVASIHENYGIYVDDVADFTLWEVIRRCAAEGKHS
jgi:hypothetical protein